MVIYHYNKFIWLKATCITKKIDTLTFHFFAYAVSYTGICHFIISTIKPPLFLRSLQWGSFDWEAISHIHNALFVVAWFNTLFKYKHFFKSFKTKIFIRLSIQNFQMIFFLLLIKKNSTHHQINLKFNLISEWKILI